MKAVLECLKEDFGKGISFPGDGVAKKRNRGQWSKSEATISRAQLQGQREDEDIRAGVGVGWGGCHRAGAIASTDTCLEGSGSQEAAATAQTQGRLGKETRKYCGPG